MAEDEGISVDKISKSTNRLHVNLPVRKAERLFRTKYRYYEDASSGSQSVGCEEYSVREAIQRHIDFILPGASFRQLRLSPLRLRSRQVEDSLMKRDGDLADCGTLMTPDCARALYNVTGKPFAQAGNDLGIFASSSRRNTPIILRTKYSNGTSAAVPLFAVILTRINGERLNAGKPLVGFVNPLLYQNTTAFPDITVGFKPTGSQKYCQNKAFHSGCGWDPVTGLSSNSSGYCFTRAALTRGPSAWDTKLL